MKLFVYNFGGQIYESYEAFDDTYRQLRREAEASGIPYTRQVISGDKISNEVYYNGCWVPEAWVDATGKLIV